MSTLTSRQPPSNIYSWKIDFCSGLLGGIISVITLAPFDVARTRMALMQITKYGKDRYSGFSGTLTKIYIEEGYKGLFRGTGVTLFAHPLYNSLFFAINGQMKKFVRKVLKVKDEKIMVPMIAATFSGWISELITAPFWMIRTRIQAHFLHTQQIDNGGIRTIFTHMRKIYNKAKNIKNYNFIQIFVL